MHAGNKTVRCDCGYEARADDEDRLVATLRKHAREAHEIEFTRDEALRIARRADDPVTPLDFDRGRT